MKPLTAQELLALPDRTRVYVREHGTVYPALALTQTTESSHDASPERCYYVHARLLGNGIPPGEVFLRREDAETHGAVNIG